jgi:hypothetical protein
MKANETKSVQITFTLKKDTCPPVQLNNIHLPQTDSVKYLGIHLDCKLTWCNHISAKRKQLDLKNIEILERFQSKVLRIITDAPWCVPNAVIKHDLQVPSVRQEVRTYSVTYHAILKHHPNDLVISLLQKPPHNHRLNWYYPADLATHF